MAPSEMQPKLDVCRVAGKKKEETNTEILHFVQDDKSCSRAIHLGFEAGLASIWLPYSSPTIVFDELF
jgi:hypothetical protein